MLGTTKIKAISKELKVINGQILSHTKEAFQRYIKAGVGIAMGTDMALDPEMGANAKELEIYLYCGMTPMAAIQTATKNTAEAIWLG